MKRSLNLVIVVVLLVLVIGCKNSTSGEINSVSEANPTSPTDQPGTAQPSIDPALLQENPPDQVKVSIGLIFPEMAEGPKRDYLEKRFGIKFDLRPLTLADWDTQINTWVSTGDSPDLVWWDLTGSKTNQYHSWATQGAFKPITDEMLAARPNLAKLAAESTSMSNLKIDGKLYYWPTFLQFPKEAGTARTTHWVYRRDWAKAVGLYKEGDVYTWDEWVNLIRTVVQKDPGHNGPGKTAGLISPPWGFLTDVLLTIGSVPVPNNVGYYKGDDGKYIWSPATPEFKKELKITQDLYKEGLIYKDNISFTGNESNDMFSAGLAFATSGATVGTYTALTGNLVKAGLVPTGSDAVGPAIVLYDNTFWLTEGPDYWTGISFSSKISDLAMNRVLNMYNYLAGKEGGMLYTVGFEGKDYEYDASGNVKILWEPDETQPGKYKVPEEYKEQPFLMMPGGQHNDLVVTLPTADAYDTAQNMQVWTYPRKLKKLDKDLQFFSAPNKDKFGDFSAEVVSKIKELVVGSNDIEKDWDAYVKSKMPLVQKVLDEINEIRQ